MKVYDLIQELMKHPMDLDVVIDVWDGEFCIYDIEDVEERLIDCKESGCGDVLAQIKCVVLKIE
jgi:hypothetical protein